MNISYTLILQPIKSDQWSHPITPDHNRSPNHHQIITKSLLNYHQIITKLTLWISTIKMTLVVLLFFWSLENSVVMNYYYLATFQGRSLRILWRVFGSEKTSSVFCNEFRQIHSKSKHSHYHLPYFTPWFGIRKLPGSNPKDTKRNGVWVEHPKFSRQDH